MHDLIIIGGGAAALAATSSALGKQLNVLVIYEDLKGKAGQRLPLRSEEDYFVGHMLVHLAFPEEQPAGEAQLVGEETIQLLRAPDQSTLRRDAARPRSQGHQSRRFLSCRDSAAWDQARSGGGSGNRGDAALPRCAGGAGIPGQGHRLLGDDPRHPAGG